MEPPDPSFADESNVTQEYAVLVFDVLRAAVSLPFQVHRLKGACISRPGRLLECVFQVCERNPKRSSTRQPCAPSEDFFQPSSRSFKGCCCGVLRVGASLPLPVGMLRPSHLPHRALRTNPVFHAAAYSAVPMRPQWKTLCRWRCHWCRRPASEFPWYFPTSSGLVRTCVGHQVVI